ncbi:separin protein [Savitreella phatthalungensis]
MPTTRRRNDGGLAQAVRGITNVRDGDVKLLNGVKEVLTKAREDEAVQLLRCALTRLSGQPPARTRDLLLAICATCHAALRPTAESGVVCCNYIGMLVEFKLFEDAHTKSMVTLSRYGATRQIVLPETTVDDIGLTLALTMQLQFLRCAKVCDLAIADDAILDGPIRLVKLQLEADPYEGSKFLTFLAGLSRELDIGLHPQMRLFAMQEDADVRPLLTSIARLRIKPAALDESLQRELEILWPRLERFATDAVYDGLETIQGKPFWSRPRPSVGLFATMDDLVRQKSDWLEAANLIQSVETAKTTTPAQARTFLQFLNLYRESLGKLELRQRAEVLEQLISIVRKLATDAKTALTARRLLIAALPDMMGEMTTRSVSSPLHESNLSGLVDLCEGESLRLLRLQLHNTAGRCFNAKAWFSAALCFDAYMRCETDVAPEKFRYTWTAYLKANEPVMAIRVMIASMRPANSAPETIALTIRTALALDNLPDDVFLNCSAREALLEQLLQHASHQKTARLARLLMLDDAPGLLCRAATLADLAGDTALREEMIGKVIEPKGLDAIEVTLLEESDGYSAAQAAISALAKAEFCQRSRRLLVSAYHRCVAGKYSALLLELACNPWRHQVPELRSPAFMLAVAQAAMHDDMDAVAEAALAAGRLETPPSPERELLYLQLACLNGDDGMARATLARVRSWFATLLPRPSLDDHARFLRVFGQWARYSGDHGSAADALAEVIAIRRKLLGKRVGPDLDQQLSRINLDEESHDQLKLTSSLADAHAELAAVLEHSGVVQEASFHRDEAHRLTAGQSSLAQLEHMLAQSSLKSRSRWEEAEVRDLSRLPAHIAALHNVHAAAILHHKGQLDKSRVLLSAAMTAPGDSAINAMLQRALKMTRHDEHPLMRQVLTKATHQLLICCPNLEPDRSSEYTRAHFDLAAAVAKLCNEPILGSLRDSVLCFPSIQRSKHREQPFPQLADSLQRLVVTHDHLRGDLSLSELSKSSVDVCSALLLHNAVTDLPHPSQVARALELAQDVQKPAWKFEARRRWFAARRRNGLRVEDMEWDSLGSTVPKLHLPPGYSVVQLTMDSLANSLLLTRHTQDEPDPFLLQLPLARHAARDADEETFSYAMAYTELRDIIDSSDQSARIAKDVRDRKAKNEWWRSRRHLDERLGLLVENIQTCWLGGFRGVLTYGSSEMSGAFETFRRQFARIFLKHIPAARNSKLDVDVRLLRLFTDLGPVHDEDALAVIEDLLYFMLDLYQFRGQAVAYDEVDVDQMTADVQAALGTYHDKAGMREDKHLVLILDRRLEDFPWESIPCLRGRSVSRMPSFAALQMALRSPRPTARRQSGTYVLNPGKDLQTTQATFEGPLNALGWTGWTSATPDEATLIDAITTKDIFIYFGHGGAEQYIRASKLKRTIGTAGVAILMGCSSGMMHKQGCFDSWGTPLNYLIAGSPCIVANLWDVTDKDIDRYAIAMLGRWGLTTDQDLRMTNSTTMNTEKRPTTTNSTSSDTTAESTSRLDLCRSAAQSRDACLLRYLNGAAPVVYGLPVSLS